MDKKYQIFVSSTFIDLEKERKAIIETLLTAGYIPVGMELFNASDDEQFEYIKTMIDYCDYYILIIGARYGSISSKTGKSFTEMEYEYAVSKKIPVLSFVHTNPADFSDDVRENENTHKFQEFKNKINDNNKLNRPWNDSLKLSGLVISSLNRYSTDNPRQGWVRGQSIHAESLASIVAKIREDFIEIEKISKNRQGRVIISHEGYKGFRYHIISFANSVKRIDEVLYSNLMEISENICDRINNNGHKTNSYIVDDFYRNALLEKLDLFDL